MAEDTLLFLDGSFKEQVQTHTEVWCTGATKLRNAPQPPPGGCRHQPLPCHKPQNLFRAYAVYGIFPSTTITYDFGRVL